MAIVENTAQKLVFRSGSTTMTFDKSADKAVFQTKVLFWQRAPKEAPLKDITDITLDVGVDRASGIEICNTMVVFGSGTAWALPAEDKKEAQTNADLMRKFLGLKAA
jgi:hypothetical protein